MPSNFEMAVVALLIVNLLATLYFNYKQENYAYIYNGPAPFTNAKYTPGTGSKNIQVTVKQDKSNTAITSFSFSDNGKNWIEIKPTSISTSSGLTTAYFPVPLPSGLKTNNLSVKVTNSMGLTSNAIPVTLEKMCPAGQAGKC
jgi:hypothetical protein